MIQTRTASEILRHALDQCAIYGAPAETKANLRGALAFVEKAADIEPKDSQQTVSEYVPAAPVLGVVGDE